MENLLYIPLAVSVYNLVASFCDLYKSSTRCEKWIARVGMQQWLLYDRRYNEWCILHYGVMCEAWYKFNKLPQWIQDKVNSDSECRRLIR